MPQKIPLAERFARYIVKSDDPDACWQWTGALDEKGYGRIGAGGRGAGVRIASRVSYEVHVGPIPPGLFVLHRCDNPPCCNPRHLFLGTNDDNFADMIAKGRRRTGTSSGDKNGSRLHPDRVPRGERQHLARLNADKVREIRALHAMGNMTFVEIAAIYGVNPMTVLHVVHRNTWRHVE